MSHPNRATPITLPVWRGCARSPARALCALPIRAVAASSTSSVSTSPEIHSHMPAGWCSSSSANVIAYWEPSASSNWRSAPNGGAPSSRRNSDSIR
jgi:hypothetical protein